MAHYILASGSPIFVMQAGEVLQPGDRIELTAPPTEWPPGCAEAGALAAGRLIATASAPLPDIDVTPKAPRPPRKRTKTEPPTEG